MQDVLLIIGIVAGVLVWIFVFVTTVILVWCVKRRSPPNRNENKSKTNKCEVETIPCKSSENYEQLTSRKDGHSYDILGQISQGQKETEKMGHHNDTDLENNQYENVAFHIKDLSHYVKTSSMGQKYAEIEEQKSKQSKPE